MAMRAKQIEQILIVTNIMFLLFAATNVNYQLGIIFVVFMVASAVFILMDSKRTLPFRKDSQSIFGSILSAGLGYVALILTSTTLIIPGINNLILLLSSTTPVLATSVLANNLIFILAVPIAESMLFFAVIPDLFSNITNIQVNRRNLLNLKLWIMFFVIATAFSFFHLTAKGLTAFDSLVVVWFMAIISLFLVAWNESYESAIWFHIICNGVSLLF